ncbi:MAG: ABC transporter permease [Bacteroidales bacterium]
MKLTVLIPIAMIKTDLRASMKSLNSQKFYSALNILGLSAGLAAFILIALYVRNEMSYDRSLPDADRVYRVVRNEYTLSPPPMAASIKESIPEIEFASRFILGNSLLLETGGRFFTEDKYFWTDNEFLSIFPLEFIRGNSAVALESPTDILLSESLARKYFGDNDPVGSLVTISRKDEYRVAGVFRDFPGNSHFSFNIVLPIDRYFGITGNDPASWRSNYVYTYIKLTPGAEIETVNKKYTDFEKVLTEWTPASGTPYSQYFFFQPVTEIHLFSHRKQEIEANSDISNVYIFSSIGLLILVIAIINYINLATAMAGKKERSMALKKILGARKIQLARLVFIESFLVAIASIVLAAVIAYLTLPYFNSLMDRNISIGVGDMPVIIPGLLLLALLVGFVSGWAPSVTLTKVSLVSVLGSSTSTPRGGRSLRSILVLMQFIIAIILIIVTINMKEQLGYISSRNPGTTRPA